MSCDHAARQAPTLHGVGALPGASPSIAALAASNTNLETAVRVAQRMLAAYGDSSADGFSYPAAYGALCESLRLLLRALDAEPDDENFPGSGKNAGQGNRESATHSMEKSAPRCPAAHVEDPTPCGGPLAVTVLDAHNAGAKGCEWHAARLLASLNGGRVYPLPDAPDGAAIRTFTAAGALRPFPWRGERP